MTHRPLLLLLQRRQFLRSLLSAGAFSVFWRPWGQAALAAGVCTSIEDCLAKKKKALDATVLEKSFDLAFGQIKDPNPNTPQENTPIKSGVALSNNLQGNLVNITEYEKGALYVYTLPEGRFIAHEVHGGIYSLWKEYFTDLGYPISDEKNVTLSPTSSLLPESKDYYHRLYWHDFEHGSIYFAVNDDSDRNILVVLPESLENEYSRLIDDASIDGKKLDHDLGNKTLDESLSGVKFGKFSIPAGQGIKLGKVVSYEQGGIVVPFVGQEGSKIAKCGTPVKLFGGLFNHWRADLPTRQRLDLPDSKSQPATLSRDETPYQRAKFKNGDLYWTPKHGSLEVYNDSKSLLYKNNLYRFDTPQDSALLERWQTLQTPSTFLGYPLANREGNSLTELFSDSEGSGKFVDFEYGSIVGGRNGRNIYEVSPRHKYDNGIYIVNGKPKKLRQVETDQLKALGKWDTLEISPGVVGAHMALLHTNELLLLSYIAQPPGTKRLPAPPHGDSVVVKLKDLQASLAGNRSTTIKHNQDGTSLTPEIFSKTNEKVDKLPDIFCGGHTLLADGRLMTVGGVEPDNAIYLFDPETRTWKDTGKQTAEGRWYPNCITLPDGRVLVAGGRTWNVFPREASESYEIFTSPDAAGNFEQSTEPANYIRTIPKDYSTYPFVFVLPSQQLFVHAGKVTNIYSLSLNEQPLIRAQDGAQPIQDDRFRTYNKQGSCVLLPLVPDDNDNYRARIMLIGGGGNSSTAPALDSCKLLDLDAAQPRWNSARAMHRPRLMPDAVLLPDGTVLAVNGCRTGVADHSTNPVYEAEIYDPATDRWTLACEMVVPRLYHSTALLLPDGRVVTAGSDSVYNQYPFNRGETRLEFFSPPYLFKGERPNVLKVNGSQGDKFKVGYGESLTIDVSTSDGVPQKVVLMRCASTTHSLNTDQRHVELRKLAGQTSAGNKHVLSVKTPPNGYVAPPGYYMLFVISSAGVPAVAKFVQLGPKQTIPEQPNPEQPNPEQPSPEQPNPEQPNPEQPNPEQPNPEQPTSGQPNPGQPNPEQPTSGQPNPGQPNPGQPNPGQPTPEQPTPEQPNPN